MRPVARATLRLGTPSGAALDLMIKVVLRPIQHRGDVAARQAHGQDALAGCNEEAHPPGMEVPVRSHVPPHLTACQQCFRDPKHSWFSVRTGLLLWWSNKPVHGSSGAWGSRVVRRFPLFACGS